MLRHSIRRFFRPNPWERTGPVCSTPPRWPIGLCRGTGYAGGWIGRGRFHLYAGIQHNVPIWENLFRFDHISRHLWVGPFYFSR